MEVGKRLIPVTIDAIAHSEPDRPWASMPATGLTDFVDIPFKTLANAINRTAWWITNTVGQAEPDSFPTLAYLGPSDLRYYVMLIAIVKAGYKPLFLSHLNSQAANLALYEKTDCRVILNAFVDVQTVAVDANRQIITFQVPTFDQIWDTAPILHTSGSSGLPKPVTFTHGAVAWADELQLEEGPLGTEPETKRRARVKRSIVGFPPFHGAGMLVGFQETVWYNGVIVFPPSHKPLDGAMFRDMLAASGAGGAYLLPRVLEQIGRMPDALAVMKTHLDFLVWVGGPISTEAGDAISKVTSLLQNYASTEIGSQNALCEKSPEDWNYNWFEAGSRGRDFRPLPAEAGEKQLYELFIKRDEKHIQQVFRIFRDIDEWPTKDLFSKHPTRPDLWLHEGRSDDLIVTINGNNLNPRPIEVALRSHPLVREALVLGSRRPRVCVIIEPNEPVPPDGQAAFIDAIMPALAQSNTTAPLHGKLQRELVLVAHPDQPLPRTGKGTVQRGAAAKMYAEEVDALYAALPEEMRDVHFERVQGTSV